MSEFWWGFLAGTLCSGAIVTTVLGLFVWFGTRIEARVERELGQ